MVSSNPTKSTARARATTLRKHTPTEPELVICVHVVDGGECRPAINEDVRVFWGTKQLPLTEQDGKFILPTISGSKQLVVVATPFLCTKTCRTFDPAEDRVPVHVTQGAPAEEVTITYSARHQLVIEVEVDDYSSGRCYPSLDQVKVFHGDHQLPLKTYGSSFVSDFELESALLQVVATPFFCVETGYSLEPSPATSLVQVDRNCTSNLKLTYVKKPRLVISVDIDGPCRPTVHDVNVYEDGRPVTLTETADGFVSDDIHSTGAALLEVVACSFKCGETCRTFEPTASRTLLQLESYCPAALTLSYVPASPSISITPQLVEPYELVAQSGGEVFVPDVRFLLFYGTEAVGVPLVQTTTAACKTVTFSDVPAETVTLLVEPPPKLGDIPIALRSPHNTALRLNVGTGQDVVLDKQYEFVGALGTVIVTVIDHTDGHTRLADIPVRLESITAAADSGHYPASSDHDGIATFDNVAVGAYRVTLAATSVCGRDWIAQNCPVVTITADDRDASAELKLAQDRHLVHGTVYGPDGQPAPNALVHIHRSLDDRDPVTVRADDSGRYNWEAPHAGSFYLAVAQQDGHLRRLAEAKIHSDVELPLYANQSTKNVAANGARQGPDIDTDPTPVPLLFGKVDLTEGTAPTSRSGGRDGSGNGQSAGATVSAAVRDVLGYRTRTTDAKGFVMALQRSFTCTEKAGYTVCEWTPRSYAATIPADLGALTGAQASIYERAKVSANSILPLLDGLTPLGSAADKEDIESIRSIVRSRITEIVEELSLEGGPRVQRVDELFERLTGFATIPMPNQLDPIPLEGEFGKLGERFEMLRAKVNTLAEEENFTNYQIINDNILMMFYAWYLVRNYFERTFDDPEQGSEPFLGTQLVLLSRQLNVVAETVNECYFAMDSVFLGQAERQTVLLPLEDENGRDTAMFLSELLDWVYRFSTDEGPQLIEEAGTDGVNAFRPTIERLAALTYSAAYLPPDGPGEHIPPSYFAKRVKLALQQLASQLYRAESIADAVIERLNLDSTGSSDSKQGGQR